MSSVSWTSVNKESSVDLSINLPSEDFGHWTLDIGHLTL